MVHYDMFYRNLMAAFANALGDQWNDEIARAWGNIYTGMTTIMDAPEQADETEPLVGWGLARQQRVPILPLHHPFGWLVSVPHGLHGSSGFWTVLMFWRHWC